MPESLARRIGTELGMNVFLEKQILWLIFPFGIKGILGRKSKDGMGTCRIWPCIPTTFERTIHWHMTVCLSARRCDYRRIIVSYGEGQMWAEGHELLFIVFFKDDLKMNLLKIFL